MVPDVGSSVDADPIFADDVFQGSLCLELAGWIVVLESSVIGCQEDWFTARDNGLQGLFSSRFRRRLRTTPLHEFRIEERSNFTGVSRASGDEGLTAIGLGLPTHAASLLAGVINDKRRSSDNWVLCSTEMWNISRYLQKLLSFVAHESSGHRSGRTSTNVAPVLAAISESRSRARPC